MNTVHRGPVFLRHVYVTAAASSINLVSLTINCGRRYADCSINTIGQWLPLLTFIFLRGLRQFIVHGSNELLRSGSRCEKFLQHFSALYSTILHKLQCISTGCNNNDPPW